MTRERFAYFLMLLGIWAVLCWSLNPFELLLGAFVCVVVVLLTRGLVNDSVRPFLTARAAGMMLWYTLILIADMAVTGLEIVRRLCHPRADRESKTSVLRTSLKNPLALTILANTISLLHDTAVVDVVPSRGELLVQCDVLPGGRDDGAVLSRYARYQTILEKLS